MTDTFRTEEQILNAAAGTSGLTAEQVLNLIAGHGALHSDAIPVIHDNDFAKDQDGLAAYYALHKMQDEGLCNILAVIGTVRDGATGVSTIANGLDAVRTFWGHASVPIGLNHAASAINTSPSYFSAIAANCPHDEIVPWDSKDLYRDVLTKAADNSVTIMLTGPASNLQAFMESEADGVTGIDLIRQKVKLLVCGAGYFPTDNSQNIPNSATNFRLGPAAGNYLCANWPTSVPILYYGESSCNAYDDFPIGWSVFGVFNGRSASDPMLYLIGGENRGVENSDVVRVVFSLLGYTGALTESEHGKCAVDAETGVLTWTPDATSLDKYLIPVAFNRDYHDIAAAHYLLCSLPAVEPTKALLAKYDWTGIDFTKVPSVQADASGKNRTMTAAGTNGPVYLKDGVMYFGANGEYLESASSSDLGADTTHEFTVVADIYIENPARTDDKIIISKAIGAGYGWTIGIKSKKWRFGEWDGAAESNLLSATDLAPGWNRIICVHQYVRPQDGGSTTIKKRHIYVNGALDDGSSVATYDVSGAGVLRINGCSWSAGQEANVPVGMVRIYGFGFTAADVANYAHKPRYL